MTMKDLQVGGKEVLSEVFCETCEITVYGKDENEAGLQFMFHDCIEEDEDY
tara:strand:- start:245 stop:397 length:153 start_codon:yes stop_codon:yes gene_type:complete